MSNDLLKAWNRSAQTIIVIDSRTGRRLPFPEWDEAVNAENVEHMVTDERKLALSWASRFYPNLNTEIDTDLVREGDMFCVTDDAAEEDAHAFDTETMLFWVTSA